MRIFRNNIEKALKIYNNQKLNKEIKESSKVNKKDELKLSDKAKDFQVAMKALKQVPDIRQERVDEIKKSIELGTYKVDSGKIVEKMFESTNFDRKV